MIPLLSAAASKGLGFITQASGGISALQMFLPGMNSFLANITQYDWKRHPIVPPSADQLISAWIRGFFNDPINADRDKAFQELLVNLLRRQGIAVGSEGYDEEGFKDYLPYIEGWKRIFESQQVRPGLMEGIAAFNAGFINQDELRRMAKQSGAELGDWAWTIPLFSQRLGVVDLMELYKRGTLSSAELDNYLKFQQIVVPGDRDRIRELTTEMPGISDIIRFVVREAFNPAQVEALGLDLELNENKNYLASAKAAGLGPITIRNDDGQLETFDFAKMAWYAHWENPSPGQAYQFVHRFYDKSRYGPSPWLRLASPFGETELNALLKANDYSPRFRKHLAGISYNPLTRIDVRRVYASGIITKADVYHNYRAGGYADQEAQWLTEWVEKDVRESKTNKMKTKTLGKSCQSYSLGLIDKEGFLRNLKGVGFDDQMANFEVNMCQLDSANKLVGENTKSVRAGFLSGSFTEQEAIATLKTLGLKNQKIQDLVFSWNLNLSSRRKVVAAKEISQWYIDDIITIDELVSRLAKLTYHPPEITRIAQAAELDKARRIAKANKATMLEAQRNIEKMQRASEKARKEAERIARERQKELERAIREREAAENKRLMDFLSARSEANLRKWLADESITEAEVAATFRLRGWAEADIERWLAIERNKG